MWVPACFDLMVLGPDTILGSDDVEEIKGGKGADTITANGGNDEINGN